MITEIFLSKEQLQELSIQVVGRKAKEAIVRACIEKSICGRSTAYFALDVDKYDGENATHRLVANEAVEFLKKNYAVTFPWAEVPVEA